MIHTIARAEVFKKYPNISAEISRIQKEMYDADALDFLEDDASRLTYLHSYDALHLPAPKVETYYKVLSIRDSTLATYAAALAKHLQALMVALDMRPYLILSHLKTALAHPAAHSNHPSEKVLQKLLKVLPTDDFENALAIGPEDFSALIENFFVLGRENQLLPEYILFCDQHDTFAFFVCQYGNVHTIEFGIEILNAKVLIDTEWVEVKSRCYEKFTR